MICWKLSGYVRTSLHPGTVEGEGSRDLFLRQLIILNRSGDIPNSIKSRKIGVSRAQTSIEGELIVAAIPNKF